MEFYDFIFQTWKVMEFRCGSLKVMENDVSRLFKINNQGRFFLRNKMQSNRSQDNFSDNFHENSQI